MAPITIVNIKELFGTHAPDAALRGEELAVLPSIKNAWLSTENGLITAFGPMHDLNEEIDNGTAIFDAAGRYILPSWCDSHTHLVFAASREDEFIGKIKGMSYAEIAAKGGGILNSARKLAECPEEELYTMASERLKDLACLGTGAIEIKSGYGLTLDSELKMLRVIKRLRENSDIIIKATFLGAHAFPEIYRDNHEGYVRLIIDEMIPAIAADKLADFIDVFCETGFFSTEETERICEAGIAAGLKPKIHANQLSAMGATQTGVKLGALSVDHLETMDPAAIASLASSKTIGTLLPTAAFFLRMPYQPARTLIDTGSAIAIASDFNPGSSPSGNMNLVVSMACSQLRMLPQEAVNAATINGAFAMDIATDAGSIAIGKKANLIATKEIPSLAYLPYAFGSNNIEKVMVSGIWI